MLKLYLMEGDYINTEEELELDGSDYGVSGFYQVNISEWEYKNSQGNTVDRIIRDHFYHGKALPDGYIYDTED